MKIKALVVFAALATPVVALAQGTPVNPAPTTVTPAQPAKLQQDDIPLVAHLHHVHQMEIDMGMLAQRRGGKAVKRYGAQLVKDHQQNDKALAAFAKKRGVAKIPVEKPATEAAQKEQQDAIATVARLGALKGAAFDREFLLTTVMDHDREIGRNLVAIAAARDGDLQAFLRDVTPVLQRHADAARELQRSAGAVSTAGPTAGDAARDTRPAQPRSSPGGAPATPTTPPRSPGSSPGPAAH